MLNCFEEINKLIIVMELPNPCRSLESFMSDHKDGLNETLARDIMRQAVTAAKFSIALYVCHCSLRMNNVLIDPEKLLIKYIGFTCSKLISAPKKPYDIYCVELSFCVAKALSPNVMTKIVAKLCVPSFVLMSLYCDFC